MLFEKYSFDGVIIENFGDNPYDKRVTDPLTISVMSIICREVARTTSLVAGVNLLRNSGLEAYSIAVASGCRFIRVNALTETIISDSGVIEPEAPRLKSLRLHYPGIGVFADILVKHASSMSYAQLYLQARGVGFSEHDLDRAVLRSIVSDAFERGDADAIILTGFRTGESVNIDLVRYVRSLTGYPILIGSGVNDVNIKELSRYSDGFIVGSFVREEGRAGNPLSPKRLDKLSRAFKEILVSIYKA
jgi:membrane complex biogenesis BtpA family protein